MMYTSGVFWFFVIIIPVVCLFGEYFTLAFRSIFFPTLEMTVRQREARGHLPPALHLEAEHVARPEGVHTGYAFSQCESTASITQTDVIRRYDTNVDKPLGE